MSDMCYIGRKDCECIVLAVVDDVDYKDKTAKEIARGIRGGLKIERTTCQFVRDNMRKCLHRKPSEQKKQEEMEI